MDSSTADDVVVATSRPAPNTRPRRQPNYAVILQNDDQHTFPYVIEALQKVCGHSVEKALQLALEAHQKGRSAVWSGVREVAELKCEQIRGLGPDQYAPKPVTFPLGVYIEPLPVD